MTKPKVVIVMGSDSDLEIMSEASAVLEKFKVPHELRISSAHRAPDKTATLAKGAIGEGAKVIIAAAGYAAHLAGVIAAHTVLPVIGVPLAVSPLQGLDSLLSTVQMPAGIPVATVAVGKAGARNAGLLAVEILALSDPALQDALILYRQELAQDVETKDAAATQSRSAVKK